MQPDATQHNIAWFKDQHAADKLNLSPDFQRNHVWLEDEASYLIDTILHELPFPEIYIRNIVDEDGGSKFEVVDGQQRIRTILGFAAGDFPLRGDDVSPKFLGKTFKQFTPEQRTKYWAYKVVVRELGAANDAEIRDLFRRLNKHAVTLNDQELRHAHFKGKFIKLMEDIADDEWWAENKIVTTKQIRRMEDIEFISELFIGVMSGPQNKKDTIDDYYEQYEKDFPDKEEHNKLFRDTKALIEDVLPHEELRRWSGKSDFYSLFLAFSHFAAETITGSRKKRLLGALSVFRDDVDRTKKKDAKPSKADQVNDYVEAVTRAASDIDRRRTRIKILSGVIKRAVKP